jgi:Leucine-rich repeat (LRR) protein
MPCPPIPQPNSDDVIDEAMINDALAATGGGAWPEAETLDLSFRRVAKIENLVCFDRLTSLSLSNNRINEIAGVAHLVTLTSLDLSFNKIEAVPEELTQLVNLRELSLHSNGLSDLSTIDCLPKLSVLNVGAWQGLCHPRMHRLRIDIVCFALA